MLCTDTLCLDDIRIKAWGLTRTGKHSDAIRPFLSASDAMGTWRVSMVQGALALLFIPISLVGAE